MYGTYQRLNVSIYASNREVIRAAQKKIAVQHRYSLEKRCERKAFYQTMLGYHKRAQELAKKFRL